MGSEETEPKLSLPMFDVGPLEKTEVGKPLRRRYGDWISTTLTGPCGDTMELQLQIRNSCVTNSTHRGDGCRHSRSCLRFVAESAKGRAVDDLPELSPDYIAGHLIDLPKESWHCAQLAYDTLMQTVDEYFHPTNQDSGDDR